MATGNKVAQPFIISLLRKHTYHCWELSHASRHTPTTTPCGGLWPLSTCDILPSCLDAQGLAVSASGSGPWASVAPCSQAGHPCASAPPPPPALGSSRSVPLDHHPVRNGGILDDDHNAVADDKAQVFLVGLLHVLVVHNPYMAPDAGVFVDNGVGDRRVRPHAQGNGPLFDYAPPVGSGIRSSPRPSPASPRSYSRCRCASGGR